MKKGDKLYVRVDYKVEGNNLSQNDLEDHYKYLKEIAAKRYLVGGGFLDRNGGMVLFEARNLKEAIEIADNDPLIERKFYTYELFEWKLTILSEEIQKDKSR
ncbi:hypothetical protein JYK00_09360 [Thermosipho ferrireducens]|uniref:YCII-related domain-containing protein n=1 Tax=Thermosipho ferrireducens TaxID=2571116 RepID=A0ABX7S7X5_9BACT|nr:YciI family protein [Thermosipho ferrireducens]QTA37910.1 hypothetical protein JYK00_09360 [Thermosipho ferrireducens]